MADRQAVNLVERIADSAAAAEADSLLTESDIEDAFANLLGHTVGETKAEIKREMEGEIKSETASEIYTDDRPIKQSVNPLTEETSDEKVPAESEQKPAKKMGENEKNESVLSAGNILQPDLFS